MIAKSSWFSIRKFGGWGLTPNCWQGWVYIAVIILPVIFIPQLNLPGFWSTGVLIAWGLLFAVDFVTIFLNLKKDERDILHEALAERNAMWFMVTALGIGIAYQSSKSVISNSVEVDPIILIALLGSTIVKAITHWHLRDK